jgi:hypothetical protein
MKALEVAGDLVLGGEYYKTHKSIGRLAKIFDYSERLPFHLHQMKDDAVLVGKNPKEEAYYFIEDADIGKHPETFFGIHPYIAAQKKYDIFLPYLKEWNSDLILRHSRAYLNVTGEGFHLPAGVLHAPGIALTIELQEDPDVFFYAAVIKRKENNLKGDNEKVFGYDYNGALEVCFRRLTSRRK